MTCLGLGRQATQAEVRFVMGELTLVTQLDQTFY